MGLTNLASDTLVCARLQHAIGAPVGVRLVSVEAREVETELWNGLAEVLTLLFPF